MKKAVTKRIKVTGSGKLTRRKMRIGHNGTRDTKSQKTSHRKQPTVARADIKAIKAFRNMGN